MQGQETRARHGIVVARVGSTAMDQTTFVVGAGSAARVEGWITNRLHCQQRTATEGCHDPEPVLGNPESRMTRTNREVYTSFFLLSDRVWRSLCSVEWRLTTSRVVAHVCAKECMYGASHHVHTQHGSGVVNLVVSRRSGRAVRAPSNAGDKRVKRKHGWSSAAAVAARIERGYLKRTRTAGGTACVNNHVDSRGTGTEGSSLPVAELASTTARDGGDGTHSRKRKPRTASAELDGHARTARADRSGRHTGDRQARPVRRRSDEVRGFVVQTEIVLRNRGPAVPARVDDDRSIVDTETQRNPRQRGKCTQYTDVLHSGDDNCRRRDS